MQPTYQATTVLTDPCSTNVGENTLAPARCAAVRLGALDLLLDPAGLAFAPRHGALLVADLHLGKGAAFARRGAPLPPYDVAETLDRLARALARWRPRRVICLGDNFHDREGPNGLDAAALQRLRAMAAGRDWLWLAGNHDPEPHQDLPGRFAAAARLDEVALRHLPDADDDAGLIHGHLHPCARPPGSGRSLRRPCFLLGTARLAMPAFGAFTGGLDIGDPAIRGLFDGPFDAYLLGRRQLHRIAALRLVGRKPGQTAPRRRRSAPRPATTVAKSSR